MALEPTFEELPAFRAVGLKWHGTMGPQEIPAHWEKFLPHFDALAEAAGSMEAYGICANYDPATGEFDYLAAARASDGPVPDGLEVWDVPASRYAVFETTMATLPQTFEAANAWMQSTGTARGAGMEFERYPEDFTGKPEDKLHVLFPIA